MRSSPLYLDYAATTPVDPRVVKAMRPYFTEKFGNPGSLHSFGQNAIAVLDRSRETIAQTIGANFREIIFTGSATEANNIALRGVVAHAQKNGIEHPKVIVSAIEHESVLETAKSLERSGKIELVILPVDATGIVDIRVLEKAIDDNTILVSVMHANNETGVIEPIEQISALVQKFRDEKKSLYPLLHTDAVQSYQFLDCTVDTLGIDFMTISAHKIYGPKGIGALYIRSKMADKKNMVILDSIITGGGQEYGLRSGTENVPLAVGFAKAGELIMKDKEKGVDKIGTCRDMLWEGIKHAYPKVQRNSPLENVLPNILNVAFPSYSAEDLLIRLDLAGVAVSAGSACTARSVRESHVLKAYGYSKERSSASIRFSLGRNTREKDIARVVKILTDILR